MLNAEYIEYKKFLSKEAKITQLSFALTVCFKD